MEMQQRDEVQMAGSKIWIKNILFIQQIADFGDGNTATVQETQ